VDATRWVIFPMLTLTGFVMWQMPLLRSVFRKRR
jgi:hypothetical protein